MVLFASFAIAGCAGGFTTPATRVTDTTATVTGLVFDPEDATISYWFEYGATKAYGSHTIHRSLAISDRDNHSVSEDLEGLTAGTTFHYRVCANHIVPICGNDEKFTTTGGATQLSISASPALSPDFDPQVSDYVTRCDASPVTMSVSAPPSINVAIDSEAGRNGTFTEAVPLDTGRSFTLSTTSGGQTANFHVRCLPNDFPDWAYSRPGNPSAHFYITTPQNVLAPDGGPAGRYVSIFDDQGVPIWWRQATGGTDAKLLPDGKLVWGTTSSGGTSTPGYETHTLDGSLVKTWRTVGSPTDLHDYQSLPNGNALIGSYPNRPGTTDLTAYGGPNSNGTPIDAEIQEVLPDGTEVWSWNAEDHIGLAETPARWYPYVYGLPKSLPDGRKGYDWAHINSFQQVDDDTIVASFRHLDAVYGIDKSDGSIIWKLGGTTTPESLTVLGDTENNPLGGQHYARMLPDGTLTIYDNNTNESASPRGVRYRIDLSDGTATMLESINDPDAASSPCCGSAAELGDNSWLVSWGGTPLISEFGPSGNRHFKLSFQQKAGSNGFSYRVAPIVGSSPTIGDLRAGMDAMP